MEKIWPANARPQALMSTPPGDGGRHLHMGRDVQVFMLAVLQKHPAKVLFIANNVDVQIGEDCLHQEGPQVLLLMKGKGGQVRIIAHPKHPPPPPPKGANPF